MGKGSFLKGSKAHFGLYPRNTDACGVPLGGDAVRFLSGMHWRVWGVAGPVARPLGSQAEG